MKTPREILDQACCSHTAPAWTSAPGFVCTGAGGGVGLLWELHAEKRCSWREVSDTPTRQLVDLWALWPIQFLSLTHTALADSMRTLSLHPKILSQARTKEPKSPRGPGVWQAGLFHASWLGDTEQIM